MVPPQVIVPPLPPVTPKAGAPATPVIEPPPAPHVPVTALRVTLPAVAVALLNVPLTAPVEWLSAFTPETLFDASMRLSVPKLLPVRAVPVAPVTVTPVKFVVPPVVVVRLMPVAPPLTATLVRLNVLAEPELRLRPVAAPVTLTLLSEKIDVEPMLDVL